MEIFYNTSTIWT